MTRLASQSKAFSGASADSFASTNALRRVRDLVLTIRALPGLTVRPDPKGVRLEVAGTTIGRLHLTGLVEAQVGRELSRQLLLDGAASPHPAQSADAGRVAFLLRSASDVERAAWLLRLAYLALDPELNLTASDVASGSAARAA